MKINKLFLGICMLGLIASAQKVKKEELFTINKKPYYTDEFVRIYNKNLDLVKDESQKDLDQYLELFIAYKLKINKAYNLGLNNSQNYRRELNQYRRQLSKNYLTDTKVTQELIEEAYRNTNREIKASHILVMVNENASPADTLKAYNKMAGIRKRAVDGEDFQKLAVEFSEDPSVKDNKGDLGYFSAFRMVYPFEKAAFNTPKGQVSKIVKTRYGYHLIKVTDERKNRGELQASHIMIQVPPGASDEDKAKAKERINEIYAKLQKGENFESLARQFSDDKSSAARGGSLARFTSGQLNSTEFEEVAFGLNKDKPLSEPFQTSFGWHIVKYGNSFPVKSLDEMQAELEAKVSKDDRSKLIASSMNEKLRKRYTIKRDEKLYKKVKALVDDSYYKLEWKKPENTTSYKGNLITVKDSVYTADMFLNYLSHQQKAASAEKPIGKLVDKMYEKYLDEQLQSYYDGELESEFPEFAAVMDEYRDGLLMFELMEKEIWQRSKNDTVALQKFFDLNKNKYQWDDRADVIIASATNEKVIKEAYKMLKKNKSVDEIKQKLNKNNEVNVMLTTGVFEKGNEALPKSMKFAEGMSEILHEDGYYYAVKVLKKIPAGPKTLDEARGKVTNDFQQYLEENWVKDLKSEFAIEVNRANFENLKKEMKSK